MTSFAVEPLTPGGVDTDNAGGAFSLYTSLGFELQQFVAYYEKLVNIR
jgi:ribosomal protein S18 acetylase RimI-like enzyme